VVIEVEIKVAGQEEDMRRLTADATFVNRKNIVDEYYDYADFRLAVSERWLRKRDGKFELKVSLLEEGFGDRVADRYDELETDEEIIRALGLPLDVELTSSLATAAIRPYATIVTDREHTP